MGIRTPSNAPKFLEHNERNSPKLNVFCAMSITKIYGHYFFKGDTVKADEYFAMLRDWLLPQLENDVIFMQDGAPPHWALEVRALLNERLSKRWIGRATDMDDALVNWPPRSPDLTPCDFFLWGYIKGKVFYSPLPATLDQIKSQNPARDWHNHWLQRMWSNFHRRLLKVKARKGHSFEHLRI